MSSFEEKLAQLSVAILEESPAVGHQFYGVATKVVDPEQFYIVPIRCYSLMHILESPGKIAENIEMFSTVIYLSPTLGRHVRGIVLQIYPNNVCIMNAMDYGTTDSWVKPSDIFTLLHPEAGTIPALAQFCQLSMCYPREGVRFSHDTIEAFKFFMGQEGEKLTITIIEQTRYKLGVLVMSSQCIPDDISTALAFSTLTVF